ncbi:hypothetical protein NZK33_02505 [Cyanobium sp. FGCU-6]|nr:hypothetical protein [Cyanobium sp. FGCU6]
MNPETANQSTSLECPYKGLIPYGEKDAPIFFGREDWCQIIINNLLASHLTLLYGASGVGKSSVLLAGVANRLKKQSQQSAEAQGWPEWAVIVCRDWRDDPLTTLRERISTELEALIGRPLAEEKECGAGLSSLLQAASQAVGRVGDDGSRSPGKLLLILDQFEEYFLYHPQDSGAGSFAVEFPAAVNDSRLSLNVLISLREDSLAKLDRFKQQLPDLFANRLQIDHLDRAAAIDAIRKPIEEFNRKLPPDSHKASVEPALIQDVLDQVKVGQIQTSEADVGADQPAHPHPAESETLRVETPFLQLVMTRLWEEESRLQSPPRLRRDTLQRLGGAGTIVREHLERLMAGLPESSKRVAAIIFDKLVTSGLTKIAYPVFELTDPTKVDRPQDLVNRTELEHLLEHLSSGSQRILRPLPPALDQPKEQKRYEIFHDVLAKPILEWRRGYRERAEREEERQQHAQELRRERRKLWISAGIGLPLLAYTIYLGLINSQLTAKQQELTIIESAQQFKGQQLDQIDALVQAMEAGRQLSKSWGENVPGSATYIAANLRHILDSIKEVDKVDLLTQEDASARLIRFNHDGSRVGIVFQDNHFELRDLQGQPINTSFSQLSSTSAQPEASKILSFAFARSGEKLATVSSDGVIRIWDRFGRQTHSFASTGLAEVVPIRLRNRLHFSPDGQRLAVIDQEREKGVLRVFPLGASPPGLAAERFGEASDPATPSLALVRFSPAGNLLGTATENGEIRLFDAFTGRALPSPSTATPALWIASMEFSEDGQALAASAPDGVRLWQRDSQGRWNASLLPALNTSQLRFSKDGNLLATGSLDGWARVWDARRPKVQTPLAAYLNQAPVQDVRFMPDGRNLLTVSTAGLLHEWEGPNLSDLETSARQVRLSAAAFSADGRWLAEAALGERSVCLQPLPLQTPGTFNTASSRVGGCTGTTLPVPTTQSAPNVVIARLGINPQTKVVGLPWRGPFMVWNQQGQIQRLKLPASIRTPDSKRPAKPAPSAPFSEISFSPDGRQFAVVARGGEDPQALLCPVELSRPEPPCVPMGISADSDQPMGPVTSVQFLPKSGTRLLFSTTEGQICSGTLVANMPQVRGLHCQDLVKRHGSWWQLSVSPDGSTIGLAGFDGTLYLFRQRSKDRLEALPQQPIKASAGPLSIVSFSPDGRVIAVVALNGTASLWDQAGRQLASFSSGESGGVGYLKAAFTSDGSKVRLVTKQGDLHVKNVEDLPRLLERGCTTLRRFLDHPHKNESPNSRRTIQNLVSFCKR